MASSPPNRAYSHSGNVNTGVPPSQAKQAKVYQIDFTAVASGKRIASSKRRVRWRFGFANPQALANGETGTACRGEEHDVTLVWSITSGKRLVLADGQEVHYSSSRNSIFDFSWTMRGNHVLKIVAHAAPPLSVQPGFRQYDFFVDGQSFFTFPKVFRLGLAPGVAASIASPPISPTHLAERGERRSSSNSGTSTNIANLESPNNPDEEEAYLQEAIRQSLQDDDDKKPAAKAAATSNDLLDFGSTPALPAPLPALVATTSVTAYGGSSFGGGSGAGGGSDPFGYSSTPSFPTTAAPPNPYAVPATAATASSADPWASMSMTSLPPAPVPTQGIEASAAANGYRSSMPNLPPGGPMASSSNGYGTANTLALTHPPSQSSASAWALPTGPAATPQVYATPAPVAAAPTASPWAPPPSISTSAKPSPYYNGSGVPMAVTPQAQPTPSTIGFMSPPSDFAGFADTPAPGDPIAAPPATAADPALFTMSALSNGGYPSSDQVNPSAAEEAGGSAADQVYAKLVNMDTFSLVSKTDAPRSNPFEFSSSMSNTIGGNRSLADIQSKKASSGPAKPVMNTPVPAPGFMVVAASQNGSYASSYGMQVPQAMMQPQTSQAYGMGVGQQPPMSYGMQQPQPPPPAGQTPYGMPQYQQQPAQVQPPYGGAYYGAAPQQPQPGAGYY